ncbi:MAG TPA: glycosyltransferase [Terriglobales bacterium]|nr:glycosyltransferase [Terriglobales bacterium]
MVSATTQISSSPVEPRKPSSCALSIGLPVYNGELYLEDCIDSILSQTVSNFELIISDNASSDRTEEICRRYSAQDSRVRYYRSPRNRGVTWNFRQVVLLSSGQYFLWMAHDDVLAPNYVECCLDVLQRDPGVVLCYSRSIDIDEHGTQLAPKEQKLDGESPVVHQRFRQLIRMDHNCEPIFGLIRAEVLKKTSVHGDFPDSDRCVLAELALYGKFHKLPGYLFFHREHSMRVTRKYPTRQERMFLLNPDRHLRFVFPHFRQLAEYIAGVRRAPLTFWQRITCYLELLKWIKDNAGRLLGDLKFVAAQAGHSLLSRRATFQG